MKFDKLALAYTVAIFYGALTFLMMAYSLLTGVAKDFMARTAAVHWASYSWGGAILMTVEYLVGGFVLGWLFAWLYNYFAKE
jgi:hypothetical protein